MRSGLNPVSALKEAPLGIRGLLVLGLLRASRRGLAEGPKEKKPVEEGESKGKGEDAEARRR